MTILSNRDVHCLSNTENVAVKAVCIELLVLRKFVYDSITDKNFNRTKAIHQLRIDGYLPKEII
jgi:hypothetical protein